MNRFWRAVLPALVIVLATGFLGGNAYAALGNTTVAVPNQSLNEFRLELKNNAGQVVPEKKRDRDDRGAVIWWEGDPGDYTLSVYRGNTLVGTPTKVEIRENRVTRARLNTDGSISMRGRAARTQEARRTGPLSGFSFGPLAGFGRTPTDGDVTARTPGLTTGSTDLGDTIGFAGFDARYRFGPSITDQLLGMQLFVMGTYMHYFGGPFERAFLNLHPTAGDDTGAGAVENWAMLFGVGTQLNIWQRLGLSLMFGFHLKNQTTIALGDESGGGGQANRFHSTETLVGPWLGAELDYKDYCIFGTPVVLFARGAVMFVPDQTVRGTSSLGFNYDVNAKGGPEGMAMFGARFPLQPILNKISSDRF